MGLETGNYISALVQTNPVSSDNVSEGDDHLQLIKKILKQNFPVGTDSVGPDQAVQVLIAKDSPGPTVDTSASGHAARAMGLLWLDTTNDLLKIRNKANDAWITLAVDPETSNSVDINAGTIDGTTIGAATASTAVVSSLNVNADGATVTGIKDEDDMSSDSAVKLATQQSIKAYVDTQLTAEDLDISTDTGGPIAIDLDSETLAISGGEGIDTSSTGSTVTIAAEEATSANKGVASFSTDNFLVSSGAVTVKDAGIANAELADMAANTVKVRNANSSGVPSDLALATTEIMIGDGTGFTAAALSGDVSMTNAGAVTVDSIQGTSVTSSSPSDDQYLKYSASSTEWQCVSITGTDKLTTKGDLLVYNTVDSETRLPVGTNDLVLTADSTATNGVDWAAVSVPDNSVTLAKLEDGTQGDVLYYGASGAPARLGFGTSGYFLKTQGTGANPIWAAESDTTYTAGDGLDLSGTEFSTDLLANGGLEIQSTELSVAQGISQYDVAQFASGVADNDFLKIDGTSVEGRSATELLSDVSSIDNSWTGSQRGTPSAVTDGTLDLDTANNFTYTPAANDDLEFSNETAGQAGFITLINPSAYTISLGSEVKKGSSWDVSTAGTYLVSYYSDGTSVYVSASEALS